VASKLKKMGWLCSDTAELAFEDVRVPARNLVGEEGTGFVQLMKRFESERLLMAAQAVATGQRCLHPSVEFAKVRTTFGERLAQRQVIRHRLADMRREVAVARTYVHDVLVRWSAGHSEPDEVSIAKNVATAASHSVADAAPAGVPMYVLDNRPARSTHTQQHSRTRWPRTTNWRVRRWSRSHCASEPT
jgi:acyl-CoA dehydrogenase